jgi:hypothetical protein
VPGFQKADVDARPETAMTRLPQADEDEEGAGLPPTSAGNAALPERAPLAVRFRPVPLSSAGRTIFRRHGV